MGKHKLVLQRFLLAAGMVLFAICSFGSAFAQSVTQGYLTDNVLQNGMIVRISPKDTAKVEAVTQKAIGDMFGVVVSSGSTAVSLSTVGDVQQVYVATYGQYDVLVSTQEGSIKRGDYITLSALTGVGMKASSTQQLVVGKALQSFDGRNNDGKASLKTESGNQTVSLGHIRIEVSVAHNPLYQKQKDPGVPDFLSKAAQLVTDRPVSAFRIYVSLAVIALSLLIAGSILFAGVRTGMVAVGRNPLARHSIVKNMISVTIMALIVFAIGLFAVYLLLRI